MRCYLYAAVIVVVLLFAGRAHAALSFAADDNSNAALYYLPITLTNNQGSTISSGTEVCIGTPTAGTGCNPFNPALYTKYMNSNASNVNFQDGAGTLLNSWIETPAASSNAPILWWVKTNASIGANSSLTIYMVFVATGSNSMNATPNHTGAGPLYTTTYGQYDNGTNVFKTQYTNFAGTSTPSGWAVTQSTPASFSIHNGVYAYSPGTSQSSGGLFPQTGVGGVCETTGLTTGTSPTIQSVIAEWLEGGLAGEGQAPLQIGTYSTANGCTTGSNGYAGWNMSHGAPQDSVNSTDPSNGVLVGPVNTISGGYVPGTTFPYPLFVGSTYTSNPTTNGATGVSINYGALDKPAGVATLSSMGLNFSETSETGFAFYVPFVGYWARWRSYPPNGVEPTSTYGQLSSVSSLAPIGGPVGGSVGNALIKSGGQVFVRSATSSTATISFIGQGGTAQYSGSGDFTSAPFTATAGDTIVVPYDYAGPTGPTTPALTLTTAGYTWNATTVPTVSGGSTYGFFYAFNVPGGPATFTTNNITVNNSGFIYGVYDISNLNGVLDQTVNAAASGHVAATTTQANEVAISITTTSNDTATKSAEPGYTLYPTNSPFTMFQNKSQTGATCSEYVTVNANTGAAGTTTGGITSNGNSAHTGMLTFETNVPLKPQVGSTMVMQ